MRAVILLALLGCALAAPKTSQRIVGGTVTTVLNYPYMVNMRYAWWGSFWSQRCGGSLINNRSVLSAAHCFVGDVPVEWRAVLGTSYANGNGGTTHTVSQLILHAQYDDVTSVADIAVLRLTNPAVFSNRIQPARIPSQNYWLPDGTTLVTLGWGTTSTGGSMSSQLRHVEIDAINQEICAERYAFLKTQPGYQNWPDITDDMLCAGILDVGGRDACQGDSGGPLAQSTDIIVGVVSWGFQCANPFYPGVNARVSYYSDWVVANS